MLLPEFSTFHPTFYRSHIICVVLSSLKIETLDKSLRCSKNLNEDNEVNLAFRILDECYFRLVKYFTWTMCWPEVRQQTVAIFCFGFLNCLCLCMKSESKLINQYPYLLISMIYCCTVLPQVRLSCRWNRFIWKWQAERTGIRFGAFPIRASSCPAICVFCPAKSYSGMFLDWNSLYLGNDCHEVVLNENC